VRPRHKHPAVLGVQAASAAAAAAAAAASSARNAAATGQGSAQIFAPTSLLSAAVVDIVLVRRGTSSGHGQSEHGFFFGRFL